MKCPQCQTLNKGASQGSRCKKCSYHFVFSPKTDHMTDGRFQGLLQKVSRQGRLYFTEAQLYSLLTPDGLLTSAIGIIALSLFVAFLCGLMLELALWLWFPPLLLGVGYGLWRARQRARQPLQQLQSKAHNYLKRWQQQHGPLAQLISQPRLLQPPPQWQEADVYAYGVERILIVERMLLVDWLVQNQFHMQAHALIISEQGYPDYLLPLAHKLLNQRPDLPVFLLHDAQAARSPAVPMRRRVEKYFPLGTHPVTDLGLDAATLQQLPKLRALVQAAPQTVIPVDMLPYAQLSAGLLTALVSGVALASALANAPAEAGTESDFG